VVAPAELFPELDGEQYVWLRDQIEADGQRDPILVTVDGEIVDGRHRMRACEELGIKPKTRVVKGTRAELVKASIARNLPTRVMTTKERTAFAVRLVVDEGWTHDSAGKAVGVDQATVTRHVDRQRVDREDNASALSSTKPKKVRDTGQTKAEVKRRRDTVKQLRQDGLSVEQAASAMGIAASTVREDMRTLGLPSRPQSLPVNERPAPNSVPWRTPSIVVEPDAPLPPPVVRQYQRSTALVRIDSFTRACAEMNICNQIAYDFIDAEDAGDKVWMASARERVALLSQYAQRLTEALTHDGAERAAFTNYGRDDISNDL
jgi:ParB-like chromosome segregation protein Spo0J